MTRATQKKYYRRCEIEPNPRYVNISGHQFHMAGWFIAFIVKGDQLLVFVEGESGSVASFDLAANYSMTFEDELEAQ